MSNILNWFRDRPRFCWTLVTWVTAGSVALLYADGTLPAWAAGGIASFLYITALRVDRRNRSATRAVRAARDAFRRPGSVAWIEGSRRFGGRQ